MQKICNHQVIFRGKAHLCTGNVLGCYYLHWYNVPIKVTIQSPQNTNVQFGNEGLPSQQTGIHAQILSPALPEDEDQIYIQMNNKNTSTLSGNKLNMGDCYIQQNIETPSISQLPPQDESYRPGHITENVPRQNQTITEDDWFNESVVALLNRQQDLQRE